jgi:hypothetical protein
MVWDNSNIGATPTTRKCLVEEYIPVASSIEATMPQMAPTM